MRLRKDLGLKGFADLLAKPGEKARDERLIARWESGEDRAPWEELLMHPAIGPGLIVALAELHSTTIEIETTVRVRR